VTGFLNTIEINLTKQDSISLCTIMNETSGYEAKMWGTAIIGFGSYHYKYDSGRAGDAPLVGFSPRKNEISLYLSLILLIKKICFRNLENIKRPNPAFM